MHREWTALLVCCTFTQWTLAAEESVQLKTHGDILQGTLEIPTGNGPWPVALIIAGSGPTDRDGNSAPMKLVNNHLKLLAEALAEQGIASLRYDKRGVGESAAALQGEEKIRFATYVLDAQEWGRMLQRDKRFAKLHVVGHSEGSLIGMLVARRLRAGGFVSIAGAGMPAADVLREQLATKLPKPLLTRSTEILAQLEKGKTVADIPQQLMAVYRPSVQPYLISWFKVNPVTEVAKLSCPVLIVDGKTDIQVTPQQAELLAAASDHAVQRSIEGMNHVLKSVSDDLQEQLASYRNPDLPVAEELVAVVSEFINKGLPEGDPGEQQAPAQTQEDAQAEIVGHWESVDYVQAVDEFKPEIRSFQGELFLKDLQCMPDGQTSTTFTWNGQSIIHADGRTQAQYFIKLIDGTTYLFVPWLSGDVVDRGMQPSFYVLKKSS